MQDQNQPQHIPPASIQQPTVVARKKNTTQFRWGLVCLLGPTLLLILTILTYAIVNFISAQASVPPSDVLGDQSAGKTIMNTVLFLIGALSIITWLPGVVAGIILLATRK